DASNGRANGLVERRRPQSSEDAAESGSTSGSTTNEKLNLTSAEGGGTEHRGKWTNGIEFLLSCVSMSVGLGNVWRFPYIAYQNGGGAFLIPYLLLLFLVGRPIYYLELIVGQFSGRGPIKMWKCVPALKGVGFAQLISVSYVAIFYNYLMGVSLFYFFASFASKLPWTVCNENWIPAEYSGYCTENSTATNFQNQTWAELYYKREVLNESRGLWDVNSVSWKLVLCLLGAWTLVYLSIVKGVTSLGKVAYFTAIFPYVVLVALLVVSLFQEGALAGIAFFFTPQFEKLLDPIVWYRAVEQSFFSLAVCFGSLVMYSSYNDFNNNVSRDCIIISLLDTFTSLLAGCVIFAVLGNMAHENGEKIEDVVTGGPGLAFIAYPEGLSKISFIPQL
ncbi:PREDICTED: sodium-dependent nutrient amino acid transporter 1-like, partial [Rhagoletis zephyria]|uniref:sodium-dependent nutrient amino acid transporter 1-like n=1 Tax=Rhagoletis zephyria TaxID=28612 RepID=UPI000811912D